jgi:hypothetical protein
MNHAIGYLGHYDRDFRDLKPGVRRYRRKDGTTGPIALRPKNVGGIFFGYLECQGKKFVAVRAEYGGHDVFVNNPVKLSPPRHTDGKGLGPNSSRFGDDSARHLLADMIAENPERAELRSIAAKLGWSTSEARY